MKPSVEVLDGIMGSGKTTEIFKWIEKNRERYSFIYISPLLSEVETGGRVDQACPKTKFISPEGKKENSQSIHDRKSSHLLELLENGCNISCTHSLYLNMSDEHFLAMQKHNYVVIIDEELGMIEGYTAYSTPDVTSLISLGIVSVNEEDGMLVWLDESAKEFDSPLHKFNTFKRHVKNGLLYVSRRNRDMLVTQLPVKLIDVAKRVIVLTYLFDNNVLSSFLKLKGLDVIPFKEVELRQISKSEIAKLITLHEPTRKFRRKLNLTVNGYSRISQQDIKYLSSLIRSVANSVDATDYETMFTFPKSRSVLDEVSNKAKIKPRGLVDNPTKLKNDKRKKCWIASTTRATNEFKHKSCLIHCYDRYPNACVESYLTDHYVPIDRERFALSELLQWVWRSQIRDGKPIHLHIESSRMKKIFLEWLSVD